MTNLELIARLDELAGKATQREWEADKHEIRDAEHGCFLGTMAAIADHKVDKIGNADYLVALHNNYPALRALAIAGIELAKTMEKVKTILVVATPEYQRGWMTCDNQWQQQRNAALAAYRQQTEPSEQAIKE